MIRGTVPNGKEIAFIRNRNLFYVCCSRPKKRLFFFVSVPIDQAFRCFLINLVGEGNMLTYSEYMQKFRSQKRSFWNASNIFEDYKCESPN